MMNRSMAVGAVPEVWSASGRRDLRSGRLRMIVVACGSISLALGMVTTLGWLGSVHTIVQPLPGFAPMQFNTAASFSGMGITLILSVAGYRRFANAVAVGVGLLAAVTASQYVLGTSFGIDEIVLEHPITTDTSHPGRMAPNTALGFLLAVGSLAIRRGSQSESWRPGVAVALSGLVFALGAVSLVGYAGDLAAAYAWGHLTSMSITAAFGMTALGIGCGAMAMADDPSVEARGLRWLPVAVAVVLAAASVLLWIAMQVQHRSVLHGLASMGGALAAGLIDGAVSEQAAALHRIGAEILDGDAESRTPWADAYADLNLEYSGALLVARVDPNAEVVWQQALLNGGIETRELTTLLSGVEPSNGEQVRVLKGSDAGVVDSDLLLITIPGPEEDSTAETLAAVYRASQFFRAVLQRPELADLSIEVRDSSARTIFVSEAPPLAGTASLGSAHVSETPLGWQVIASPSASLQHRVGSVLPTIVLASGLLLAVLTAGCLHLLRIVHLRGSQLQASNEQLEQRVTTRTDELEDARRQLEKAYDAERVGRQRLAKLLDSLAEGIYTIDKDGNCTFCNASCLRMLGYERRRDLLGRNMHELIHHTRRDGSPYPVEECRVYRGIQQGSGAHVDDELLWRRDGTSFEAEYWSYPVMDDEGAIVAGVVTFLDVTGRNNARRALERRSAQQAAVAQLGLAALRGLESQRLMDRVIDTATSVLDMELCKILELQPDGQHLRLVTGVGWAPGLAGSALVPAGADSQAGYTLSVDHPVIVHDLRQETRFRGPQLLLDHGVVSGMSTIIHRAGRPWGVLGVHTRSRREFDDTDVDFLQGLANVVSYTLQNEKATREIRALNDDLEDRVAQRTAELQAANRELEAFSYSVSHDLRAPLRAISGFASILEEDHAAALDADGARLLGVIRGNAAKMGLLIDDLLTFSRLGRRGLKTSRVDMDQLARESLVGLVNEAGGRRIEYSVDRLPAVTGDPALLRQVWLNLLGNAVKYSRDSDPAIITVTAERAEGEVVFQVADNGAGFDMAYVDKLFGVFQRLHHESEFPGTGVGLALAQRIVARHGGRIWAEGQPGEGARFSFSIPEHADG